MKDLNHLRILFFASTIIMLFVCSCEEKAKTSVISNVSNSDSLAENPGLYIDLKKVLGNRNPAEAVTVQVKYDHYFNSPKKYQGFFINRIIDSMAKLNNFDTASAIVVFECIDGYKPIMNISKIFDSAKGYIVYKDLDLKNGKDWPDSISSKFKPYYLVWDDVKKENQGYIWPYGLVGLRLISKNVGLKFVYPFKNLSLVKGFNLFKENCMKCHSINKIGGSMGPEFNIPKNITEYWNEEDIILFSRNPHSYRYNSSMPAMNSINDEDFKEIILYLKYMKGNKLK